MTTAREASEARSADAPTGSASSPSLTGGEETKQGAKVDWCTATWQPDPDEHVPFTALGLLYRAIGPVQMMSSNGMFGYSEGRRFFVDCNGTPCHIGRLDWGGTMHGGRARLDLFGAGCGVVRDWVAVRKWIAQQFDAKLTRVDLAVDCLLGEFTVDDAVAWYEAGEFKAATSGRQPRHSTPGDWLKPHYGRTLEVGRRENGKMCRVYEKGRQLGDSASTWTRFEVEIRNNDRELPLDVLTACDKYFVGAYRCLQRVLDVAGERIKTRRREGEIAIDRLTTHLRSSYGQLVQVLRLKLTAGEVLDAITRPGIPGRLSKSSLAEFTTAASPSAYLKGNHHEAASDRD